MQLRIETAKDLKNFTTLGIGGKAAFFTEVQTKNELKEAFFFVRKNKLPFFLLGRGSNVFFDDAGFSGLVILNRIDFIKIINQQMGNSLALQAGSGCSLYKLVQEARKSNFSDLDFTLGIPASLGGAVYMNAGAFGFSMADVLEEVEVVFADGTEKVFSKKELVFDYRFSSLQKLQGFIASVKLLLKKALFQPSLALQFLEKRQKTQPLSTKNAGSVFRNPQNFAAAYLIEKAGLKKIQMGGAKISDLHANFIINQDQASSQDMLNLIGHIKKVIFQKYKIQLKEELVYVPKDGLKKRRK